MQAVSIGPTRASPLVVVMAVAVNAALLAQVPDTARPPLLASGGAFMAARLNRPPVIDGREWIAADVRAASSDGAVPGATDAFSLVLNDCGDHGGDFERCHLLIQQGRADPVRIDRGFTGWFFVTPDARDIVTEPLYVLDVREWKQYALFETLRIPNYASVEAISRDGKRLVVARQDCAIDCGNVNVEYYEVTLP